MYREATRTVSKSPHHSPPPTLHTWNFPNSVIVYTRTKRATAWTPKQTLKPAGLNQFDLYGYKLAMSGDAQSLAVASFTAKVWVYKLNKADGTYAEIQILSHPTGVNFGTRAMAFSRECIVRLECFTCYISGASGQPYRSMWVIGRSYSHLCIHRQRPYPGHR